MLLTGRKNMKRIVYPILFIAAIVLANIATATFGLVQLPGLDWYVTAGTFVAAATFIIRDAIHLTWGRWVVVGLIVVGALISGATTTVALAAASAIAFLVSELIDMGVFVQLRDRSLALAVLLSSLVAAPFDTVLFLRLAGFNVTWEAVAGQVLIKTALAGLVVGVIALSKRTQAEEDV